MGNRTEGGDRTAAKSMKVVAPPSDRYLELQVEPNTTLALSMTHVREVLTVEATSIVPIPNMPACMLGILNRHSRVYWVVDLAELLGWQLEDMGSHNYNVAIVGEESAPIAIVVYKAIGQLDIQGDCLDADVSHMPARLQPYLQSWARLSNQGNMRELGILKIETILQLPGLQP
jgi:twitching motility protein PilI